MLYTILMFLTLLFCVLFILGVSPLTLGSLIYIYIYMYIMVDDWLLGIINNNGTNIEMQHQSDVFDNQVYNIWPHAP